MEIFTLEEYEFKAGDVVVCKNARSYALTEGKQYRVLDYDPHGMIGYPYVVVKDDRGKTATAYAHRFRK